MPMKMIWMWNPKEDWRPKSLGWIPHLSRGLLSSDIIAGFKVGLFALPIAMALAISSGLTPQAGIYAAILGGFLVSATGGSNIQISGPSGAFVFLLGDIVARYGVPGVQTVTLMAGLILVFLGLTGLGNAVKFLPRPIVVGFANGIAFLIVAKQLAALLGLRISGAPVVVLPLMSWLLKHMGSIDLPTSALAVLSLTAALAGRRLAPRFPVFLVVLVLGTCAAGLIHLPVETVGTRFGGIPAGLPRPGVPDIRIGLIEPLIMPALAVAILVALNSLLSAVVAESMGGGTHNSSVELIGQGFANLLVPVVGGMPVAGAIVRTAANSRLGAKSPVAGVVHALTLTAFLFVGAPLAKFIPLASLAAVMLLLAYNMSLWGEARAMVRLDIRQRAAWLVTLGSTVFLDLSLAVGLALASAVLLYVGRDSASEVESSTRKGSLDHMPLPFVTILHINHGCSSVELSQLPPIVILPVGEIGEIDQPGLLALGNLCAQIRDSGRALVLCDASSKGRPVRVHSRFIDYVGRKNVLPHMPAALRRAQQIHNGFFGIGETMANHLKQALI
jgi:SulP family sulfate permease